MWPSTAQVALKMHCCCTQRPEAQSLSPRQLVLQAVAPQPYAPHGEVEGGAQVPTPSQVVAVVWAPSWQLASGPHEVPVG